MQLHHCHRSTDEHLLEVGNTGYMAAIFHLMNHAFFKALLFLSAGAVIHAVHTEDMRKMGGLSKKLKITSLVMLVGALAISGIPPFSGFWSKDLVLESAISAAAINPWFWLLYIAGTVTAFMTAFYMFRLWFMTFKGEESEAAHHAHEAPAVMWVPLAILAIAATISGLFLLAPDGGLPAVIYTVSPEGIAIPGEALGLGWIEKFFTAWPTYVVAGHGSVRDGVAYLAYQKTLSSGSSSGLEQEGLRCAAAPLLLPGVLRLRGREGDVRPGKID
jgi:NADH-quinone oxidoreductase subunit L